MHLENSSEINNEKCTENKDIGCVILNYNDSSTTISLIKKLNTYSIFKCIFVVDGCSTDDSYAILKQYENSIITVIKSDKNGGYGYGNNIGIKYCISLGCKYVLVANPDIDVSERTIEKTYCMLLKHPECVAAAPHIKGYAHNCQKFAKPILDATYSSILLNKILKPRYYASSYFEGKKWCYVDTLPGSLVLFDAEKFLRCGLYDEQVFLYHEEMIIGKKFKQAGYRSILILNEEYFHYHSVSVRKALKVWKSKKISIDSHKIYLKDYCEHSKIALMCLSILKPFAIVEGIVWEWIKNVRKTNN